MAPRTDRATGKGGVRVDQGMAYGLIAGAALGALVMALTGDVMWVSIGPALGLLVGLAAASLWADRRGTDDAGDDDPANG